MDTVPLRLVTVVAERVLRDRLVEAVRALGATGYTLTDVHGEGTRGVRPNALDGPSVKLEVIVPEDVAEAIVAHVAATYFEHYSLIVYMQEAQVVRSSKYLARHGT
jgi:nitrogen regulatory protein PII